MVWYYLQPRAFSILQYREFLIAQVSQLHFYFTS